MKSSTIIEIQNNELYSILKKLKTLDYIYAVLWAEGSWPIEPEIDESIIKTFATYDNWLVAGHILNFKNTAFRAFKNKDPRFHEQCVIINLKEINNIEWTEKGEILKKNFVVSEENMHDDYTPYWIKPTEGNSGNINPVNIFDRFLWISLKSGLAVLNIDYEIRNKKVCIYPEDDQQWTQQHANLKYWNSLTKKQQQDFIQQLKHNNLGGNPLNSFLSDKIPLFEFLNLSHDRKRIIDENKEHFET